MDNEKTMDNSFDQAKVKTVNYEAENTIAPVDEKLPLGKTLAFALQHVLAMCAGAVAVPLIVGNAAGLSQSEILFLINADLLIAGIATLTQSLGIGKFIGGKIPMIEGTSFASVNAMVAIAGTYKGDPYTALTTIFGAVLIAGLFVFLVAPFFGKFLKFFPEVVTGTVVTIIGVSLLPVAIRWSAGNNPQLPNFASMANVFLALGTLILILLLNKFLKGNLGNLAILFGLLTGTLAAYAFGMVDFTLVKEAKMLGFVTPFHFGLPRFEITAIISLLLVMLVTMTEATGNIIAVHKISGRKLDDKNLTRSLRTDGFATMIASVFNTFPYTAFSQNIGLLSLTGIKSRYVVAVSGVMLVMLGLLPKMAGVIASVPYPVLGGAGFVLFGMVAANGIKSLSKVKFDGTKNGMIVAVSIGLALIPVAVPGFYDNFPEWVGTLFHSGITTGSLSAILLNLLFNGVGEKKEEQ
ncbi:nucleobase:cation symporter-2 family protein [Sebaldella sp. S0638]|uniref:nucleobase:cation symporter-2 family protein n=1 Tax=Sebaldella sp. S0638 TaxID=2957809 RepID=UPI00209E25A1|nr:nucleobase:cation symporter-2 family protein [Sebaldella sp. S0638]MCP1223040.1 purine permease [Sebaldella sp. S0638]